MAWEVSPTPFLLRKIEPKGLKKIISHPFPLITARKGQSDQKWNSCLIWYDILFLFFKESASHWTTLADRDRLFGEKQSILIGYEIAVHFTPPCDVLNTSCLLSQMLLLCCEGGQSFHKKATTILTDACQMEACQSKVRIALCRH